MTPKWGPPRDKDSVASRTQRSVMKVMMRAIEEDGLPPAEVMKGCIMAGIDIGLYELDFARCAQMVADTAQEHFLTTACGVSGQRAN